MGHNIPTFFFPVNEKDLNGSDLTEDIVQNLLGDKFESRYDEGIREVTSRNWWYQEMVLELAKSLKISGLEFLSEELLVLDKPKLLQTFGSLDQLLSKISSSIPVFSEQQNEEYAGIAELRSVDCSLAFQRSTPDIVINPSVDSGFEAVEGFYSFLKSIIAAINNALERDFLLIYYRPQP